MQNWPVLKTNALITAPTACSTSASSNTRCAALPPSSRVTGLRCCPATLATCLPTAVDPVNAILSTPGWVSRGSPISEPKPVTTLSTPSGTPASARSPAISSALSEVSSAGLCTTVFPAASAAAIFVVDRISGKLNGVMAAITPSGSRRVYACDGIGICRVAPSTPCARAE